MCRMIADGRGRHNRGRCSRGAQCVAGERHGIESTRMPGMASSQALHSQPTASEHTESVDGLERIVGTGRMESACGTEERAHGPLVDSNQERGNVAHCSFTFFQSATRLACSSGRGASFARPRALTIRSTPGSSCWCSLNDSRMIRRMRLRSTPPPAVRTATARPRRGQPLSFQNAVTPKNPLPNRRPPA
jgi:hypothetical protein